MYEEKIGEELTVSSNWQGGAELVIDTQQRRLDVDLDPEEVETLLVALLRIARAH